MGARLPRHHVEVKVLLEFGADRNEAKARADALTEAIERRVGEMAGVAGAPAVCQIRHGSILPGPSPVRPIEPVTDESDWPVCSECGGALTDTAFPVCVECRARAVDERREGVA